jgi:hypothetical protein
VGVPGLAVAVLDAVGETGDDTEGRQWIGTV